MSPIQPDRTYLPLRQIAARRCAQWTSSIERHMVVLVAHKGPQAAPKLPVKANSCVSIGKAVGIDDRPGKL
jgi:hypothetical protein